MQAENKLEKGYKSYENFFKPLHGKKKSKAKPIRSIDFIPEDLFGGHQATGSYNPKDQTAMIKDGDTTYEFSKIISNRTNAMLPNKKNLDHNLQLIGSYNTKTNHAGMPVTTYLFGVFNKNEESENISPSVEQITELTHSAIGGNPATWAPVVFYPSDQFAGDGLIGNYFASNSVATIHDPSGNNNQNYTFINVEQGGIQEPQEKVLIGSYGSKPQCSGIICSHAMMIVNLYGNLKNDDQPA